MQHAGPAKPRPRAARAGAIGPERLSSLWTPFYRGVFPVLWVGFGALGLALLPDEARGAPFLPLAAVWLVVAVFLLWLAASLRTVFLESDFLVVSSRREIHRFPLRDVESVSGTILLSPDLIFVRFRRPTPFGSRIAFIPRGRSLRLLAPHPFVARLRTLALQHQAPGLPPVVEAAPPRRRALRGLALGALVAALGFALVAGFVASLLRNVGPYTAALERAVSHPALVAELGEPIRGGWSVKGQVRVRGTSGTADLAIPVSGPRGEALLRARARLADDEWILEELSATLPDGRSLDLLREDGASDEPPGELL